MDTKHKPGQKGGESKSKIPTRSEPSQTRSGTSMQRQDVERDQPKVSESRKPKEGQIKSGKK